MSFLRKLSFLVLLLCIYIAVTNPNAGTLMKNSSMVVKSPASLQDCTFCLSSTRLLSRSAFFWNEPEKFVSYGGSPGMLEYDFYRFSCPLAEKVIRDMVRQMHRVRPDVTPALLRLVFHDCFIEGCDASVLLNSTENMAAEKDSPPNDTLRGFEMIDAIKAELEEICPGTVSCADILVLAAREAVLMVGGPFYPLHTGRRDSAVSYAQLATHQLPSPYGDLSATLASFASRGFDEREVVSLLGAHSVGVIHCKSFENRLYNFLGTNLPDPSLDIDFLKQMQSTCNKTHQASTSSPAPSPSWNKLLSSLGVSPSSDPSSISDLSFEEPRIVMDYAGPGSGFGRSYYISLLQQRGILYSDQQLMAGEETGSWVRAFAWDAALFRRDFAEAMMKLSDLRVLTAPNGLIRHHCSRIP